MAHEEHMRPARNGEAVREGPRVVLMLIEEQVDDFRARRELGAELREQLRDGLG